MNGTTITIGKKSFATMAARLRAANAEVHNMAPPGCFTVKQYAEANKLHPQSGRRRVEALVQVGRAELAGRFKAPDRGGRLQLIPHFRLIPQKKK